MSVLNVAYLSDKSLVLIKTWSSV